jgi:hypothetical protein
VTDRRGAAVESAGLLVTCAVPDDPFTIVGIPAARQ